MQKGGGNEPTLKANTKLASVNSAGTTMVQNGSLHAEGSFISISLFLV